MGVINDIWQDLGKISNKGFSSPNTSYRSLERPLKVVTLVSLGKTQDGPCQRLGSNAANTAIRILKIHVTLLRKVVESSTTTLKCSESSNLVGHSSFKSVRSLHFELLGHAHFWSQAPMP